MQDRLVRGVVLNLNVYGATVRLESGDLASAPAGDVEGHREVYERSLTGRKTIDFQLHQSNARRPMVTLAPQIDEPELDEKIAEYFDSTQEWETDAEGVPAHERHFLRKKRRAAHFETKTDE